MSLRRLAVFGGLTVAGLLCGGAPGVVPILAAAGSSVAGGVAASDLGGLLDRLRRSGDDLSNHDLTKAVGEAIALSISGFAQDHLEQAALETLARELPKKWPFFVEYIAQEQGLLTEIQEAQLTAWLTDPEAQRQVLSVTEWETAISKYFCLWVEIELNSQTVTALAAHLQKNFAFVLREVLKADFETGGKAFAGMTLSMLGEILRTVQGLQSGSIAPDFVNQLTARYQALQDNQTVFLQAIADQIGRDLATIKKVQDELKQGQVDIKVSIEALPDRIAERFPSQQPQRPSRPNIIQNQSRPKSAHWQGREREQATLNAWLTDENTKLSGIIAMAGMGKSTLAVKVFEERTDFVGKGWFDLGFAPRFETVARSLLESWSEIPRDTLERMQFEDLCNEAIALLQNERFLVVLDNFESVLDQGEYLTFLQRWVNGERRSEVLITSQQEPEIDQVCPAWCVLSGLEQEEGAALLAALRITEQEPGKLAEFSRLVDGHPLTLTLTAGLLNNQGSRRRQKSIEELNDPQFGDLLGRLEGQHRDQRVQLRTVLAANFGRLSAREREVLTRLAVLRLPFGEDVVMAEESGLFWGLVNRGVLTEQANGGVTVLPFVRSYLLTQVDDFAPLHRWAIDYYDARKKPYPWDVFEERDRELAEVQDYLELFHHHFELGEYEQALDMIYNNNNYQQSVDQFLDFRGFQQERLSLYEQFIEVWCDQSHWRYRASLTCLGNAYYSLGEVEKAINYHKQSLINAGQIKDKRGEGASLTNLGLAYQSLGEVEKAIDYHEQSLIIERQIKNKQGEAICLGNLGDAYRSLANYQKAIDYYEQQLAIARQIKDKQREANSLCGLGNAYRSLANYQKAIGYHEQSLTIAQQIKDKHGEAASLCGLGNAYYFLGEVEKAIDYHEQSLTITRQIKDKQGEGNSLGNLGNAYYFLGDSEKAIDYYEQWLAIKRQIQDKQGEGASLGNLGLAYNALGDYPKAIDYHEQSLAIKRQIKDKRGEANSLQSLASLYQQTGRIKESYAAGLAAQQIYQDLNLPLNALPYPQWLKRLLTFAQKGTVQFILLCLLGVIAFPFALIWVALLTLWRILRRPV